MRLNGVDFPNFNWGYKTEIKFPFEISKLGNNKISIYDAGKYYDQYKCTGTMILTETQMGNLHAIYTATKRGEVVALTECVNTGFYPFTCAVDEASYNVWIDDIKDKGMVDGIGKLFSVELTFLWEFPTAGGASDIAWHNPQTYCKEGSLSFATYSDIRFPESGFKPKKSVSVSVQGYKGATFTGVNFPTATEELERSEFDLTLREGITSNLLYKIINTYRGNSIFIEGSDNYYIFGRDQGDSTLFSVKMNSDTLKIKHNAFNDFSIGFDVVKI